jgi:hypothetical protein
MTETKETLAILKARWREVVFIIALDVVSHFINMTQIVFHPAGSLLRILITLMFISFSIIIFMFIIGFQRTVYLEDRKQQSIIDLLREGKHFILRLIGLALIYTLALAYLQLLVLWAVKHVAPDFMEIRWVASLVYQLPTTSVSLILMKLVLLIFPLIIVLDCGIFEGFKMLGRCRLRNARELVILFLVSLGLSILWAFLPSRHGMTISHYSLTVLQIVTGRFIALMIAVMAIRFVAAQNLIYDSGLEPLDSLNNSI